MIYQKQVRAIAEPKLEKVSFPVRTEDWGHTPYGKMNTKAKALLRKKHRADLKHRYNKRSTKLQDRVIEYMKEQLGDTKKMWGEILAEVDDTYSELERDKYPRVINADGNFVYDPEFILTKILRSIRKKPKDFWNMDDIIAVSGVSYPTFYDLFPVNSPIHNEFVSFLNQNRFNMRKKQRSEMLKSKNPLLMMFLYKLIAEEDERLAVSDKKKEEQSGINIQEAVIVLGDDKSKEVKQEPARIEM
jgi:hypothetical protein